MAMEVIISDKLSSQNINKTIKYGLYSYWSIKNFQFWKKTAKLFTVSHHYTSHEILCTSTVVTPGMEGCLINLANSLSHFKKLHRKRRGLACTFQGNAKITVIRLFIFHHSSVSHQSTLPIFTVYNTVPLTSPMNITYFSSHV